MQLTFEATRGRLRHAKIDAAYSRYFGICQHFKKHALITARTEVRRSPVSLSNGCGICKCPCGRLLPAEVARSDGAHARDQYLALGGLAEGASGLHSWKAQRRTSSRPTLRRDIGLVSTGKSVCHGSRQLGAATAIELHVLADMLVVVAQRT